jgi:hypothetical protein
MPPKKAAAAAKGKTANTVEVTFTLEGVTDIAEMVAFSKETCLPQVCTSPNSKSIGAPILCSS